MKKQIGRRFKIIRELKGLNQTEMGESLGIKYQHVSKYERGASVPTWENLIKLIELYSVNINWLLTGRGKVFLSEMGYEETEDVITLQRLKDSEDIQIEEILEELRKDKGIKTLIHNYIKNYVATKQAAELLKTNVEGLKKI